MGSLFLTHLIKKKENKVFPHFSYQQDYKKTKVFTGVVCNIKNWDRDNKKVKRSDKNWKLKNLQIDTIRTKLETIVNRYKNNDEILSTEQLKLELKKREIVKDVSSRKSLPVYNLIREWLDVEMSSVIKKKDTLRKTKTNANDILKFIEKREETYDTLLIDDLNDGFAEDYMVWCFSQGLAPSTTEKRFRTLNQFCNWYSKLSREWFRVETPKELRTSVSISKEEDKPFLKNEELQQVYNFTDFNYRKPIKREDGKVEWIESEDYYKHLKPRGNNQSGDIEGVVYEIYDKTKHGIIPYTTYEVYKDIFVFLCSVGCRYSDGIRMKLEHFYHGKRTKTSILEGGVEAYWKFLQQKTKRDSIPRVNEVSYEIYKKYSRGKSKSDYLFPRTENGDFISDVKFNKHIKKICKIIGLNRPFIQIKRGINGKVLSRETKKLYEVMKSKVGRSTFIYNMVLDGNYTTEQLKIQTGHKKTDVFNSYFKLKEEIHEKPATPFLKLHNTIIQSDDKVEEINIDEFPPPRIVISLKDKLKQLEEAKEFLSDKEYKEKREEVLKNPF